MERLPSELCQQILYLLDYRNLAAAQQVCRKWKILASEDNLWADLFKERWGEDQAVFFAPTESKPWRDVYAVQDRCDRFGLGVKIIREGIDYYIISRGEIQRHLGSSKRDRAESLSLVKTPSEFSMLDRILFFMGDFESVVSTQAKRCRFIEEM